MRYLKRICLAFPLLSATVSLPSYAQMTPIEKARAEEVTHAKDHLRVALQHLTLPATRTTHAWGTGWTWLDKDLRNGHIPSDPAGMLGAILRPLAWVLLPGALIYDAVAAPVSVVASPILAGNVAFHELKNKLAPPSDNDKRSSEWKVLSESLRKRNDEAAKLIGDRLIKSEDLLAFTLGFTVIHSHYMTPKNTLFLANGEELSAADVSLFPNEADQAYRDLLSAKSKIPLLKKSLQGKENFMKELVARMTVANESDFEGEMKADLDTVEQIIEKLRSASRNIHSVIQTIATENPDTIL